MNEKNKPPLSRVRQRNDADDYDNRDALKQR